MEKKLFNLKVALPHIIAILIFLSISAIFFAPQISGYQPKQYDIGNFLGMSKEIVDFRAKYEEEPLWTNSMFSGMPAYQISTDNSNLIDSVKNLILKIIPRPIGYLFILMIGFYILLLCFNVNSWLAIIGSIAFGLSSYNILYMASGHYSKVHALSFIPPLIGSVIYSYRKKVLIGAALLSIFVCLQLSSNHLQITYYFIYFLLAILLVEFYIFWKNHLLTKFFKISAILILSGVIGVLPAFSNLISTYEYGKDTMRGKSELTISNQNSGGSTTVDALSSNYIKEYSMGYGEAWASVFPNVKGGSSGAIGNNNELIEQVNPNYRNSIAQFSTYWGEQDYSGGSFYYGATIFLLFVLGMFFVSDKIKWALFSISILSIVLSWKYSSVLDLFIQYAPMFNKFRDTKMMLVLVQISLPLLGILLLKKLLSEEINKKKFLIVSAGISSIFVLFYIVPTAWFDFLSYREMADINKQLSAYQNNPKTILQINEIKNELINVRISIFKADCIRSLLFIIVTSCLLYFAILKKIKPNVFYVILGIIVIIDLWTVNKRYFNNEKNNAKYVYWEDSYKHDNPFKASVADKEILKKEINASSELKQIIDKEVNNIQNRSKFNAEEYQNEKEKIIFRELNFATNYRVLTLDNPFANSEISYYHKSIEGYHGAKLKRYQELWDFYLKEEYERIYNVLKSKPTLERVSKLLSDSMPVLNMLNTKYIIYNPSVPPIENPFYYGNAWFVKQIQYAKNADEEILFLKQLDKNTAIVSERNKDKTQNFKFDSTAIIKLTAYKPNHLVYTTSSQIDQFAVFSEIYYDKGWNVYIDGNKSEYFKANYVLRAMNIPKGNHKIEFKFEPNSYLMGRKISYAGSGFLILFVLGAIIFERRKTKRQNKK